jgi:HD-like signal output (HDOD) protein
MDRVASLKHLAAEVKQGKVAFSAPAAVALRVRQGLDDPDCQSEAAVRLIRAEPMLAARVVALANSATFNRSARAITDVRAALNLLGFRTVRNLATAMVVRQMAETSPDAGDRDRAMQLWKHSAHVAALAQLIARRVTKQDAETAMFAGIVHEISGFYLLSRAGEFPGLLNCSEPAGATDEDGVAAESLPEKEIGQAVLAALSVPGPVIAAIEALWAGYLAFPPMTLGDTLLLADQLAPIKSPLYQIPADTGELAATIDMVVGQDTLTDILAESADEVKALTDTLQL